MGFTSRFHHKSRRHKRRVITGHRRHLALRLQERRGIGDCLRGATPEQISPGLFSQQWKAVAGQQLRYVGGRCAGDPGDGGCTRCTPALRIGAIGRIGRADHPSECDHRFRMRLRVIATDDPGIEGRCAPGRHFGGGGEHPGGWPDLAECGVPDVGGVDVATRPGGGDFGRAQVQHADRFRIDTPVLERRQQAVVGGRHERHGDLLADQIGGFQHRAVLPDHQRFGFTDQAGDQESLDRQLAGRRGGQRARSDITDLHVAGGHRGDHLGTGIELAPLDSADRLLECACRLRLFRRLDRGLPGDGQRRVGREACAQQQCGGGQAASEATDHRASEPGRERSPVGAIGPFPVNVPAFTKPDAGVSEPRCRVRRQVQRRRTPGQQFGDQLAGDRRQADAEHAVASRQHQIGQ